eukprot:GHVL01007246.1.p1 GENE.GHVL01007246.1~~GHVL01007246.1.p1  ORF type:complete len:581 (-),score=112.10 GHVL01007246.1:142-1836(-)
MPRFFIDEVEVFFPYTYIYPEQHSYMTLLKHTLDAHGHCVIEMPTGTGKTVSIFSLITSYQRTHPSMGKLIFCTRTVPEMEKALEELRLVVEYRASELRKFEAKEDYILGIGLSARRNMCVHPRVSKLADRDKVDEGCRALTAPWARLDIEDYNSCEYFENFEKLGATNILSQGVYTIEDLKILGGKANRKFCPYFASRRLLQTANVVVLNYQYVIDPKVSQAAIMGTVGRVLTESSEKDPCVVVFDEAHNIDNVCIEALSVNVNRQTLERASGNLHKLSDKVKEAKEADQQKLEEEYKTLLDGLQKEGQIDALTAENMGSPILPTEILEQSIPGSIRRAEHFISLLRRFIVYLRNYMKVWEAVSEGPLSFLMKLEEETKIDGRSLKYCYERLKSLLNSLKVNSLDEFTPLTLIVDFAALVGTYWDGFIVIADPYPETAGVYDPLLQLSCLDSSLAMKPVFERFQSVILTSGTISPLNLYPKLLNFKPVLTESLPMSLDRNCLCPLIVTRGADQVPISSKFDLRDDLSVISNYGKLLVDLTKVVPDGMVCFFTSYTYMEQVTAK